MKFSVLLPTRNRLEFLKYAIASVLGQKYTQWEIIVSDNFSEEDIKGYVSTLNDERIKYSRTDKFISVTENWNRALDLSSGDYVIMLGDDDCLMKGCFSVIIDLIKKYGSPDFIYSNSFLYAYPGVLPNHPQGILNKLGNWCFWNREEPFYLSRKEANHLVRETMNLKVIFSYNMQYATISRKLIENLRCEGKFFHSPYPDYYAMTLMMLKAEKILGCPFPLTAVGISPKSFGCYFFNNKEEEGLKFLNRKINPLDHPELEKIIIPGSDMNTSWLLALAAVIKNTRSKLKINYSRYTKLQVVEFLQGIKGTPNRAIKIAKFCSYLKTRDKMTLGSVIWAIWLAESVFGAKASGLLTKILKKVLNSHPCYSSKEIKGPYKNILEVFDKIDPLNVKHD